MRNLIAIISVSLIYVYIDMIRGDNSFDFTAYAIILFFGYGFILLVDSIFEFGFLKEYRTKLSWFPVFKTGDANALWFGGLAILLIAIGLGASNGLGEINLLGVLFYPVMIGVFYLLAKYVDKK